MEKQELPKSLLPSMAPNQDVHSQEPGHFGMENEGTMKVDGPAKPIVYVKPMRCETRGFMAHLGERGQGRHGGRSHQAGRGHLRGTDLRRDPDLQVRPRRMLRPGLHVDPDHREEPSHHVEPEARQTPSFPFTEATSVHGDGLQGPGSHSVQPGTGLQAVPNASGYWVLTNSPTSSVYACLGFRPLEGSALLFTQTPCGTFVYGVPEFFTHIAY
ncbi:proline-rich protein 20G [Canis lupus familiaris]|uniref:Proline rich 20G n=3 Tax=Canis lupus TaxID=9612 RepID=A0A8C0TVX9_CANLF|nr:proline-rich protein 20G [Canis lupus familiaris]XP_038282461.1 proline-rich protein 20G [Canis lupus familiaris]XP_038421191.1 proline-rich protein 20G [Canis lupus familiaris]|eukprot:XP_022263110.1 proline-rich protein 20A-like [Canis lupus familiaris]